MKQIDMRLNHEPFLQILQGEKTVEVRLNDEKRRLIETGDCIRFTDKTGGQSFSATVVKLHRFASFSELTASKEVFPKCGFSGLTPQEATEKMYSYYTKEEEMRCGVLAIELILDGR